MFRLSKLVPLLIIVSFLITNFGFTNVVYAYDGAKAAAYADKWWNGRNTAYPTDWTADCTNFVSQAIHDPNGANKAFDTVGDTQYFKWYIYKTLFGWDYTTTWSVASHFYNYLNENPAGSYVGAWDTDSSTSAPYPSDNISGTSVGDVLFYDWDSNGSKDHAALLVSTYGKDESGKPTAGLYGDLQDQHTSDIYHVLWNLRYYDKFRTTTITIMRPF